MSQPFDCHAAVPALREVDRKSGEFWVQNPWDFAIRRENLSAYERNGVFLNLGNGEFANIGHASAADSDGDGDGGGGTLPASPTPQPTCAGITYPVRVPPHSDKLFPLGGLRPPRPPQ